MSVLPKPHSLPELTILALGYRAYRPDWDFVICHHISGWKRHSGPKVQHEFSWYHLHEICNRVFNTLLDSPDILGAARAAIDADDCEALGRFAQQEIIYGLLYPACQRELESMAAALADHGLGL